MKLQQLTLFQSPLNFHNSNALTPSRQTVEVETNIVSVERVLEYAKLPSEAPEVIHRHRPPISWPAHGGVEFNNFSTRYREGLDLVLKDVNISIKPHEKIGVVGRTGAGKSSLTLALFRIIEPASGNISIDGLNTSTIGLLDLRRRLAIIPQDAALFEGTIRDNLDPGGVHDDTELWSVLGMFASSYQCRHMLWHHYYILPLLPNLEYCVKSLY